MSEARGRAFSMVTILSIAAALAAGNLLLFALAVQQVSGTPAPSFADAVLETYARNPAYVAYLASAHALAGVLLALIVAFFRDPPAPAATAAQPPPRQAVVAPALRLLALLQQEGRLIDFLQEDIDAYSDAQVGAAVRSIHAGCRKALQERMQIERIYAAEDGTELELAPGFDPATVRLTGNVHGSPPFRGTLQHSGWRVRQIALPESPAGLDPTILAPAEVEIP